MTIILFAMIGAALDMAWGYWFFFAAYCCLKIALYTLKMAKLADDKPKK